MQTAYTHTHSHSHDRVRVRDASHRGQPDEYQRELRLERCCDKGPYNEGQDVNIWQATHDSRSAGVELSRTTNGTACHRGEHWRTVVSGCVGVMM